MGLAEDIADLVTTGGVTAAVFIGELPAMPIQAVSVIPSGGLPSIFAMDTAPNIERSRIQLLVRAATYPVAEALIRSAYDVLEGTRERLINFRRYHWIQAVQPPFYIGQDETEHPLLSCNFDVARAAST